MEVGANGSVSYSFLGERLSLSASLTSVWTESNEDGSTTISGWEVALSASGRDYNREVQSLGRIAMSQPKESTGAPLLRHLSFVA